MDNVTQREIVEKQFKQGQVVYVKLLKKIAAIDSKAFDASELNLIEISFGGAVQEENDEDDNEPSDGETVVPPPTNVEVSGGRNQENENAPSTSASGDTNADKKSSLSSSLQIQCLVDQEILI